MQPDTLHQLRGAVELATDAVDVTVSRIADAHQTIVRQVYAPFALLGPLAGPVRVVEQIQSTITSQVYQTILTVNQALTRGALTVLDQPAERTPSAWPDRRRID